MDPYTALIAIKEWRIRKWVGGTGLGKGEGKTTGGEGFCIHKVTNYQVRVSFRKICPISCRRSRTNRKRRRPSSRNSQEGDLQQGRGDQLGQGDSP
jgi:hypothetical protein